jgi:hypothetical protein
MSSTTTARRCWEPVPIRRSHWGRSATHSATPAGGRELRSTALSREPRPSRTDRADIASQLLGDLAPLLLEDPSLRSRERDRRETTSLVLPNRGTGPPRIVTVDSRGPVSPKSRTGPPRHDVVVSRGTDASKKRAGLPRDYVSRALEQRYGTAEN